MCVCVCKFKFNKSRSDFQLFFLQDYSAFILGFYQFDPTKFQNPGSETSDHRYSSKWKTKKEHRSNFLARPQITQHQEEKSQRKTTRELWAHFPNHLEV